MTQTMTKTNNVFSLKRLLLFMRLELVANHKIIMVFTAATASVLFLYSLVFPIRTSTENFHEMAYLLLLFFGGFWISSLAFKDVHDDKKNYSFLTLPLSNFEKFFGKLLLTTVGYVVALSIGFSVLSLVVSGIGLLLFKHTQPLFNPFDYEILSSLCWYFVWQSLFLLGSIYFTKHVLSKIVLTASLIVIAFLGIGFIFSLLLIGADASITMSWDAPAIGIMKKVVWVFLAPVCWVITYLRLTEAEL
jgi:hypothetical protein